VADLDPPGQTEERHSFERRMASVDEKKKQQVTVSGSGCGTSATANISTRPNRGPRGNRQRGVERRREGRGAIQNEASLVSTGRAKVRLVLRLAYPYRIMTPTSFRP